MFSVRNSVLVAVSFGLLAASAATSSAQSKAKPACGLDYLPMAPGHQWTYEPLESPIPISDEDADQLKKWSYIHPPPPKKVIIKVVDVKEADGETVITLEETADKIVHKTTLTCTKDGLAVDPQSFFFAAEPGGAVLMELENLERSGEGFPGSKGFKRGSESELSLKADLMRKPAEDTGAVLTNGKLELERKLYVTLVESVATPAGKHSKSQRVEFDLSGRVSVEPNKERSAEIPIRWRGIMWFQDGVGLVQARNRIGHWFQLVETNVNK